MYFNCAALQVVHYFLKDENLLRIDQFLRFFLPIRIVRNLLLGGMHITLIMSLLATLSCKI